MACDVNKTMTGDKLDKRVVQTNVSNGDGGEQGTSSIQGIVLDEEMQEPMIGASVILIRNEEMVNGYLTDEEGHFEINAIASGSYTIEVSYIGYETVTLYDQKLEAGKVHQYDVKLSVSEEMMQIEPLKPIIYFYPEETTQVHVQLDYVGELTHTYPK